MPFSNTETPRSFQDGDEANHKTVKGFDFYFWAILPVTAARSLGIWMTSKKEQNGVLCWLVIFQKEKQAEILLNVAQIY